MREIFVELKKDWKYVDFLIVKNKVLLGFDMSACSAEFGG
jgi:hypothetical protein